MSRLIRTDRITACEGRADHYVRFVTEADRVTEALGRMALPAAADLGGGPATLEIHHPGRVGEVLQDPDGAEWMKGRVVSVARAAPEDEPAVA